MFQQQIDDLRKWVAAKVPKWVLVPLLAVAALFGGATYVGAGVTDLITIAEVVRSIGHSDRAPASVSPAPTPGCFVSPEDGQTVGGQFTITGIGCVPGEGRMYGVLKDTFPGGNHWVQCEATLAQGQFSCRAFGCVDDAVYEILLVTPQSELARRVYSEWLGDSSNVGRVHLPLDDGIIVLGNARMVKVWQTVDSPRSEHCDERLPEGYVAPVTNTPASLQAEPVTPVSTLTATTVATTIAPPTETERAVDDTPSSSGTPAPTDTMTPSPSPTDVPLQTPETYVTDAESSTGDLALMLPQ
jgi:hypothetical protein